MELEFELELDSVEDELVIYRVKRKGLVVGTLGLDEEPYALKHAMMREMVLK